MKAFRVILHSLVLVVADFAGVWGGAVLAFAITRVPNQVWIQLPAAVALTPFLFLAWVLILRFLKLRNLQLAAVNEFVACLGLSLLWGPVVFIPIHYFTQGYLTSAGNLVALASFQLPVNSLALVGAGKVRQALHSIQPANP